MLVLCLRQFHGQLPHFLQILALDHLLMKFSQTSPFQITAFFPTPSHPIPLPHLLFYYTYFFIVY